MPRHNFRFVEFSGPTRPSAVRLDKALIALGYEGGAINWGAARYNKRSALQRMREAGVPCPRACSFDVEYDFPVVARSDNHRAGSGFWLIPGRNERELAALSGWFADWTANALGEGATHCMEFIPDAREFRVHIVNGKSIKLTEKIDTGIRERPIGAAESIIRSHAGGWHQLAPRPNAHRKSLRKYAKAACEALGAPFGAVDILMTTDSLHEDVNGRPDPITEFYVLEVNTAPALTDPNTDTCERYARAFLRGSRA